MHLNVGSECNNQITFLGHKKILAGRRLTNHVLIEEKIKIFSEVLTFIIYKNKFLYF